MKKQEAIELHAKLQAEQGKNFEIVNKNGHFKVVEIVEPEPVVETPEPVEEPLVTPEEAAAADAVVFKSIRLMKEALAEKGFNLPARDLPFLNATFPEREPGTKQRWNFTQDMVDRVIIALEAKKAAN